MFTKREIDEIATAHKAVYKAIRPNFGNCVSRKHLDNRSAEEAAARIVAAKIIARKNRKIGEPMSRTENLHIPRQQVFLTINEEREYQQEDVSEDIMTVGDELTLLRTYLREAEDAYKECFGDDHEGPAMHSVRKLAAICVRAMEHHGAQKREIRTRRKP